MTDTEKKALAARNEAIFKRHLNGDSFAAIGEHYNIHPGQASRIVRQMKANPTDKPKKISPLQRLARTTTRAVSIAEIAGRKNSIIPSRSRRRELKRQEKRHKKRQPRQGMSLLDAACCVLQLCNGPMRPLEIVAVAVKRKFWKPLAGKTPSSTLWSRILAEQKKGKSVSRFRLTSPGYFGLTAVGRKWVAK